MVPTVYGPLHGFYKVFIFAYFGAMIGIIGYTAVKKSAISTKHTAFLAFVLGGNIALWLTENLIGVEFEFLTISYLMTEGLMLLLYGIVQDFEQSTQQEEPSVLHPETEEIPAEENAPAMAGRKGETFSKEQIQRIFVHWQALEALSQREREVLGFLLENRKRKDIAMILFVTEATIKKHTSNIYKKLGVSSRAELLDMARRWL